ncbi:hypothetical protein M3P05_16345 [Sansalvadorimonas sp. 2012CJ34-2]|uniref:Tc1-like transposase DDE domain-containing protein n=1 Tax=Parendozoicomonas callyspongiae TaxID=2942213 RepID=A0ABT0PJP8_9GAMM|nr:hypothetical protein [Sansalvadorimonas sp. 2012CJ34-2]MCL6271491.1 hypothetical protein [Sansalvadorimonas sp. 2012CJ34-2]
MKRLGYGRFRKGEPLWVGSDSPGLSTKVTFYGIYYCNLGQVRIWPYPCGRKEHTVNILERIKMEHPAREIDIVWNGALRHTANVVKEAENAKKKF